MKLLLVEENESTINYVLNLLSDTDYQVINAHSFAEARELIHHSNIDIICSTHQLPDGDAFALCKHVRKEEGLLFTPFILHTSEAKEEVMKKAHLFGLTEVFFNSELEQLLVYLNRLQRIHANIDGRVLVVEDSRSQRDLLTYALTGIGLEVECAPDVEQAWHLFVAQSFNLVITDILLEGSTSGLELVSRIRKSPEAYGAIPILAVTAFDDTARRCELIARGIDDYLTKPYDIEELLIHVRQLIQKNKMFSDLKAQQQIAQKANAEKSKFVSSISHELRTPLNSILGFSKLIQEEVTIPKDKQNLLGAIEQAGHHLLELTEQLSDITRIESGNFELYLAKFDLAPLIHEAVSYLSPQIKEKEQRLSIHIVPEHIEVFSDQLRLKQILINLISNAVKYSPNHSSIDIKARRTASSLKIQVEDDGPGIEKEHLDTLFKPFNRLGFERSEIPGIGLGLSLCSALAELMNINISVKSEIGLGSKFVLNLPEDNHQTQMPKPTVSKQKLNGTGNILYIEDNRIHHLLLKKYVERIKNFNITSAYSAEEGLAMLEESSPDIIFLDIHLPSMNGWEAAKHMKTNQLTSKIPIVAISGSMLDESQKPEDLFNDFLLKPFDEQQISNLLHAHFDMPNSTS
ncbi:response regulator [Pleionea sp. CnH1-48]|uniref:hybrid sensor histidine kinase/response regulator n=1 Tax=Pleionea sp. CnH1-48 TaxID=2954494 RepID=UPI002096C657|nr:response regulator [Pleionea sp. CnH1-48]MCO7225693.1 response regulator [Pleionea sp. CnH1-48]